MSITRNRTILLRIVFPVICGSLGTWQILRWQRKQKLLKEMEEIIRGQAREIESFASDEIGNGSSIMKFKISPKSTGERALLGPRGLGSGYGYTLFEKVELVPSGEIVVLNRGNLGLKDHNQYQIPPIYGKVTVVFDKQERKPLFARQSTPNKILWKDWSILKEALNIPSNVKVNFLKVIDSDNFNDSKADQSSVLKAHNLSLDQIPNRHLEYIATWYSLAAFSLVMSFIRK